MANRQQEKEARRQERMLFEQAERRSASRKKRVQMVIGGLLGLALIGGVVVLLATGVFGGDGGSGGEDGGPKQANANTDVKLPEPAETNMEAAAETAGCKLENPKFEGAGHEDRLFTAADYRTNPPTSGTHFGGDWYEDGIYAPGDAPEIGKQVHTLEHGRINVQYKKGTAAGTVAELEAFVAENGGYHMLMYENSTSMDAAVSATAWTHLLTCPTMKPAVFDALRTFRDKYLDKGPERVP